MLWNFNLLSFLRQVVFVSLFQSTRFCLFLYVYVRCCLSICAKTVYFPVCVCGPVLLTLFRSVSFYSLPPRSLSLSLLLSLFLCVPLVANRSGLHPSSS